MWNQALASEFIAPYLDRFGPVPSNHLINAGAICLSARIAGDTTQQLSWVKQWINKLFAADLPFSDYCLGV